MDDVRKSIARSVKNGQYFVDARNWYSVSFLYPKVERTFYFLLFSIFTLLLFIAISFYNFISGDLESFSYITYPENTIKQETRLSPLNNTEEPSIAVAKYLIANYVKSWEEYNYNDIPDQVSLIVNNSVKNIGDFFSSYMSINNINSPLFSYGQNKLRTIKILSIQIDERLKQARVNFQANLQDLVAGTSQMNNFKSEVTYSMSDLQTLLTTKAKKVDFTVLKYQSSQVK